MNEEVKGLTKTNPSNDVFMEAGIIDQFNTNQQSNMTLSAYSVITQSFSAIKINYQGDGELNYE